MKIHFIGIGGIGVSALAQYYLAKGHEVSGSDLVSSEITQALKNKGVRISIGKEDIQNLSKKFDLIIYSPAVNVKHRASNILSYPEALGELTKQYFTIAVSGTHGKSTVTSMIALILIKAGLNPTVIVGTKLKEFGNSNYRAGGRPRNNITRTLLQGRNVLVIEADEHFGSFLNYWPKIIVLTSIEKDHLDYYKSLKNLQKAFGQYIKHLPPDGLLVANRDDKIVGNVTKNVTFGTIVYSLKQKEAKRIKHILKIPGEHNISNALAALNVVRALKIPDQVSLKALSEYRGVWRRFEIKQGIIDRKKVTIVSDYAHHPTEIKAAISAAKEKWPTKKIWVIFQPHQYQRTFYLFNDFVEAFDKGDEIVLCDIYDVAGREERQISKKISSKKLAEEIKLRGKTTHYVGNFRKIPQFLKKRVKPNDIILIMGAGDIYKLANEFSTSAACPPKFFFEKLGRA